MRARGKRNNADLDAGQRGALGEQPELGTHDLPSADDAVQDGLVEDR